MPSGRTQRALEALADLKVPKDIHISPNGDQVVYTLEPFSRRDKYAVSALWVADVGVNHSARQLTSGLFRDERPQWSPDGSYIAFVSDRAQKGVSEDVYLLPLRRLGGEPYRLTSNTAKRIRSFEWSPDGTSIAFLAADENGEEHVEGDPKVFRDEGAEYPSLRVAEVGSDSTRVRTLVPDANVTHFSWSPDSREIVYSVLDPRRRSQLRIVTASTFASDRAFISFHGQVDSLVWPLRDTLYFIASGTPPPYTAPAVYEARIKKKQWGSWFGWDGEAVALHRSRDCVVARIQNATHHDAHALGIPNTTTTSSSSWPFREFFRSAHDITSFDTFRAPGSNDFTVVVARSSPESASEIWSVVRSPDNPDAGYGYVKLSSHNSGLDGFRAKHITASVLDGWECDGWLFTPKVTLPTTTTRGALPTVVLTHNHPVSQSTGKAFTLGPHLDVAQLTTAGYAVLYPNHRARSGYAERYSDIVTILRKAVAEKLVDEARVTISGWAEGGFLSSLAVIRDEFTFRAAVCGGGVVDWDFVRANEGPEWPEPSIGIGLSSTSSISSDFDSSRGSRGSKGESDGKRGRETGKREESPAQPEQKQATPLLLLHGEEDEQVPVSQAIGFWRERHRWNGPVEMILYPREQHVIRERRHLLHMWSHALEFYEKYAK